MGNCTEPDTWPGQTCNTGGYSNNINGDNGCTVVMHHLAVAYIATGFFIWPG